MPLQQPLPLPSTPPPADALEIACFEVSPSGRILAACERARAYLGQYGTGVGMRFRPVPWSAFAAALARATRPTAPQASVMRCRTVDLRGEVQLNVLPFQQDRLRVVLFLPHLQQRSVAAIAVRLTAREKSVLDLAAAGLRRDRIAHALGIALPTVDMHCRNIRKKLGAGTMSAAVAVAARQGLLEPEGQGV